MNEEIKDLRARIEEIDREILELVARRTETAKAIGRAKMVESLPLRDAAVEDKVVSRFIEEGARLGVSEGTARQIASTLIRESVDAQSVLPKPSRPREVLVIGGAWKMGSWMCRYLRSRGHRPIVGDVVRSADFPNASDLRSAAASCDFIVVATPISVAGRCMEKLIELQPGATLFDISSIKAPVMPVLKKAVERGIQACSVHPMFGPDTESIFNRNIIMCDCGSEKAVDEATELLNWGGARMIRMRIEDHDALMAYVLGLSHAVNIAFFNALTKTGIEYSTLENVASTTFRKQAATSRDVAHENPELYYDIQHLNPENRRALRFLAESIKEIEEAASSDDKRMLAQVMENGKKYFGGN